MIVLFAVLKVSVLVTNDFFLLGFRATVALWVSEVLCMPRVGVQFPSDDRFFSCFQKKDGQN